MITKCAVVLALLALSPSMAFAATSIKARNYTYSYDFAESPPSSNIYLICDQGTDCAEDHPNKALALRMSGTMPADNYQSPPLLKSEDLSAATPGEEPLKKEPWSRVVQFGFNSSYPMRDYYRALDSISRKYPVNLTGYTCTIGPEKYNLALSKRRAKNVAGYLRRRGVPVQSVRGRGESSKYAKLAKNRRVEITRGEQ